MSNNSAAKDEALEKISISLERLERNFVISMREFVRDEKEAGHVVAKDGADEAEVVGERGDEEDDEDKRWGETDPDAENEGVNKVNSKKKKKAPKVEDYDVDDPFIDDSEVTMAYESVFDLMIHGDPNLGSGGDSNLEGIELKEREHSTNVAKRPPSVNDFYVYRGPIEVEVVEKEFDEPRKKKRSKKRKDQKAKPAKQVKKAVIQEEVDDERKHGGADSKKRKPAEPAGEEPEKKPRKKKKPPPLSLTERLQQLEAEIEEREEKVNAATGSAIGDVKMTEDQPAAEEDVKSGSVRRHYDIDKEVIRLEVLDALDKFKEVAVKRISEYDPLKFPTVLRGPLERYVMACLKRDDGRLEGSSLSELEKIVPYSGAALCRLLIRKIFPWMAESLSQVRPEIIRSQIREEINKILQAESDSTEPITPPAGCANDEGKKSNKKRRLSDELKQLVFEYLKCATERSLILRAIKMNSEDPSGASKPVPSSLSETSLRRSAYRELVGCWPEDRWAMSTAELSRECSMWKKRYERALLKEHGVDIEQFLVIVEKPAASDVVIAPITSDDAGGANDASITTATNDGDNTNVGNPGHVVDDDNNDSTVNVEDE